MMDTCSKCGAPLQNGVCSYCGATVHTATNTQQPTQGQAQPMQQTVINNYTTTNTTQEGTVSTKSKWAAFLLDLFFGYFGVHQFYVGKIGMGILYFFTFGLFGIGWFIDLILTATGSFKDSQGKYLKN